MMGYLGVAVWFGAGVGLGVLLVWMLGRFAARLEPGAEQTGFEVVPHLILGYVIRHVLMGLVLLFAIHHQATAGALMVFGFWVGRWGTLLAAPFGSTHPAHPAGRTRPLYALPFPYQPPTAPDAKSGPPDGRQPA